MRIAVEGTTTLADGNAAQLLAAAAYTGKACKICVRAKSTNNAIGVSIGLDHAAPIAHYIANTDQKGFSIETDNPNNLWIKGTAADAVYWSIYE